MNPEKTLTSNNAVRGSPPPVVPMPCSSGTGLPAPSFAAEPIRPAPLPVFTLAGTPRPSWRKRRFWAMMGAAGTGLASMAITLHRGHQTRVMVMNAGNDSLPALTISAAGHRHTVPSLAGGASHRWILPSGGTSSPLTLAAHGTAGVVWQWEGPLLNPAESPRYILHVQSDGTVEESLEPAFWTSLTIF